MKIEELNEILEQHRIYLETNGKHGQRADLRNADLRNIYLVGINLGYADLTGAYLCGANLCNCDLCCADLSDADLTGAYLRGAGLIKAKLFDTNLRYADLSDADLRGADLTGADLRGAKLDNVAVNEYTSGYWMICPESGAFIGYKKAYIYEDDSDTDAITINGKTLRFSSITRSLPVIIKLQVPASAKRSSATTRKCRVSKAKVLSIESIDGKTKYEKANSGYDSGFVYKVGETVKVDNFNPDRWNECSTGIHLFVSRKEAEIY